MLNSKILHMRLIPRMHVHLNLQWDGMSTNELWASNGIHMEYLCECDVKQKGAAGSSRAQGMKLRYDQTWHLIVDAVDIKN